MTSLQDASRAGLCAAPLSESCGCAKLLDDVVTGHRCLQPRRPRRGLCTRSPRASVAVYTSAFSLRACQPRGAATHAVCVGLRRFAKTFYASCGLCFLLWCASLTRATQERVQYSRHASDHAPGKLILPRYACVGARHNSALQSPVTTPGCVSRLGIHA